MKRPKRICPHCLWCWDDLHGADQKTCYRKESPYYHEKAPGKCNKYEYPLIIGKGVCSIGFAVTNEKCAFQQKPKKQQDG